MQNLFALQQCLQADYQLGKDHISMRFQPDLNSMEVQDKTLLSQQNIASQKVFDDILQGSPYAEEDAKIKLVAEEAINQYHQQCKKDIDFFKRGLVSNTEKIYRFYLGVLSLAKAFVEMAQSDKKVSHTNFVSNSWLKAVKESELLEKEVKKFGDIWESKYQDVRLWFRDIVRQDNDYLSYLDKKEPSLEEQKKFANYFFRKIVLGKNTINDFFEEEVLYWAEDREIVKALVDKTVKSYDPENGGQLSLHVLSLNWEEDKDFMEQLFLGVAKLEQEYKDLIASNTKNWEVDRLPLTDRIILEMAIVELVRFPNIPVKVTINEYIELAKHYSTPKSRQFINGILDVIAGELKDKGLMKKSGRGLMDNK